MECETVFFKIKMFYYILGESLDYAGAPTLLVSESVPLTALPVIIQYFYFTINLSIKTFACKGAN